ncbi:hypothetical protein LZ30DRAFT_714699 [Colletotrichum cereale]|nr:hypothetical protein LZ30DRAFT_714699 [Colletotrichum cereale]
MVQAISRSLCRWKSGSPKRECSYFLGYSRSNPALGRDDAEDLAGAAVLGESFAVMGKADNKCANSFLSQQTSRSQTGEVVENLDIRQIVSPCVATGRGYMRNQIAGRLCLFPLHPN